MVCENENKLVFEKLCILFVYCRFGNFHENCIFANCIKRHISDVKHSRLRQDLPISINDREILSFREGFIFTKLRETKSSRKFPNLQYLKYNRQRIPRITDQIMCVSMKYEIRHLSRAMRFPTMWYVRQQMLRLACAYAQTDQSLYYLLEYSMTVKLLT